MSDAWNDVRAELVDFVSRRVESAQAAEDIVQDVLERMHRADLGEVRHMQAWLYRAARNAIIDHYRTRRPAEPLDPELAAELPDGGRDVETGGPNAATQELAQCLRPMIDRLPLKYRTAVTLVDLEGCTQAEAARREQISLSGMKSRVQRGRERLGAMLKACCAITTTPAGAVNTYARREGTGDCGC